MNEITLDEIMKCSKKAIALAYMCKISASVYTRCPLHGEETENCPMKEVWCSDVTPQAWEEVLNSAHSEGQSGCPAGGGEHCKMMKGCRKVTPADWWNEDVLPEYKDFTPVQLAERCRRGACPVENGCCPFWPTPDGWCCLVTDQMWEDIAE